MKQKRIKKIIVGIIVMSLVFINMSNSYYAYTISVGASSNGKYQENGNCFLADRDSATIFASVFVQTLTKKFDGTGEIPATKKFVYSNNSAWENDLNAGVGYTNIDDADFMIYVGHGLVKGETYKALDGSSFVRNTNALHYYTNNGDSFAQSSLGGETLGSSNFTTIEASKWARNGTKTKWVAIFSCNFLNTKDKYAKKENIMNGLHVLMGFSSKMWIDSSQATCYATSLRDGGNIIDSYFHSCSMYQRKKIVGGVTAVAYYAKKSRNDTIYEFSSKPALNDSTQYYEIKRQYEAK